MNSYTLRSPLLLFGVLLTLGQFLPYAPLIAGSDDTAFSLECPPDVTISCEDDLYDLDKYGKAYIHDYSGRRPAGKAKVVKDLNSCGKGTITRTWTVEDYNWNIHQCSQTIYVTGGGLTEDDIIWPDDYNLEGCHPSTDPRRLPVAYGYPRYTNTDCAQPMASYKDEVFEFSKSCKKVIRKWTVIDWCEYKPNERPLPGYFTYYQIIKVSASDKPTIVCPPDSTYMATKDCDSTLVDLDSVLAYTVCDSNLTIRHNSPYAFKQGPDATGIYPVGTTKVTFNIEYGCGKDTSCTVEITVLSKVAPVPYCRDGVITTLMGVDTDKDGKFDAGMVDIWAKDLDIGSYHPCGNLPLTFSFEADSVVMSTTFTCDDLGKNEVRMYVTDQYGNQTYCRTYVIIQNNNVNIPDCEPDTTGGGGTSGPLILVSAINGSVLTDLGKPVPGTEIILTAFEQDTVLSTTYDTTITARLDTVYLPGGGTRVEIRIDTVVAQLTDTIYQDRIVTSRSSDRGLFETGKWRNGAGYLLSAEKEGPVLEGLDIMDALMLIQYLIGAEDLDNPYRLMAADVNRDNKVTYTDFELLYNVIMGIQPAFPTGESWVLIPAEHQFSDPDNPWKDPIPGSVRINALARDTEVPFIAVKLGDVDGNVRPSFTKTLTQQRAVASKWFDIKDRSVQAGQEVGISVDLSEYHAGAFHFNLDPELFELSSHSFGHAAGPVDKVFSKEGTWFVSFAGQTELRLTLVARNSGKVSQGLSESSMDGLVIGKDDQPYRPVLRYNEDRDLFHVSVYPNPFRDDLTLEMISGHAGQVTLRIYDLTGRMVLQRNSTVEAGATHFTISGTALPGTGFYFYDVERAGVHKQGKLHKID